MGTPHLPGRARDNVRKNVAIFIIPALIGCSDSGAPRRPPAGLVAEGAPDPAARKQDPPDDSLLDIELAAPANPDGSAAAASHILALVARAGRTGAAAAVEGYRLGMTRVEVERQAGSNPAAPGGSSGGYGEASVDCTGTTSMGRRVLAAIPSGYGITPPDPGQLRVVFMDDAGQARVSRVDWSPAKAPSLRDWLALVSGRYGRPMAKSSESGATVWRWCLPEEIQCSARDTDLPSLTATYRGTDNADLELSAGDEIARAVPEVARRFSGTTGCRRPMTSEERRILDGYLAARTDPIGAGGRTVVRPWLLPPALQRTLSRRLGEPVFLRAVGGEWLARYDVGYSRDPASYSETKYVVFAPSPAGYTAVWQGDAAAARGRLASRAAAR